MKRLKELEKRSRLKFLVDESEEAGVAESLRKRGYDVIHIKDVMRGAENAKVIERATRESRITITSDKDFGILLAFHKPPGVILLRLRGERVEEKFAAISRVIEKHGLGLYGKLAVISPWKVKMLSLEEVRRRILRAKPGRED